MPPGFLRDYCVAISDRYGHVEVRSRLGGSEEFGLDQVMIMHENQTLKSIAKWSSNRMRIFLAGSPATAILRASVPCMRQVPWKPENLTG